MEVATRHIGDGIMETLLIIALVALAVLLLCTQSSTSQNHARPEHTHDPNDSYLYYRDQKGALVYEWDTCAGCMQNRADTLTRQGCQVTELHLGRRYSGELV
jgi:hypothetical protein